MFGVQWVQPCRTLVAWDRDGTENNMNIFSIEVCARLQQRESFSVYDFTLVAWDKDETENNMKIFLIEVCARLQQRESFSVYKF
jgi:hypothetical protein